MAEPVAFPQAGADHASDDTQKRTELTNIVAAASQKYALKLYSDAADLYSKATALQADLNGEMAPQNADLLYSYGRCLYHVAVSKSDVLGAKVAGDGSAGDGQPGGKRRKRNGSGAGHISTKKEPEASKDAEVAEKVVEKAVESKDGMKVSEEEEKVKEGSKPFFQIRGDDAEWGDDEDEEQQDDEEPDEEEDDDFATAYEILDVARVLLSRQTEKLIDNGEGERKVNDDVKHVRERLADTHDLQAEISLENERFTDAVADSRASLELKQELFPNESSLVAEAHFKLSLALEFASVTTPKDAEGEPEHGSEAQVDEALRKEAASHMEKAIDSSKLRVELESKKLDGLSSDDATKQRRDIAEVKDIISDMETRLEDLRNPSVSMNDAMGPAGAPADANPLGGILGSVLGESPAAQKARLEEATKDAKDLTGLIRHKKPRQEMDSAASEETAVNGQGKRKAEEPDTGSADSKRARLEDEA